MLSKLQIQKLIKYWSETAEDNHKTMFSLYRSKRYSACLFFGHLVLEKALKVLVIQQTKDFPPKIHNLLRLAELGTVKLTEEQSDLLAEVNEFNLEARYPEVKYQFYKKCTKTFVDRYYGKIKMLYHFLCQQMK